MYSLSPSSTTSSISSTPSLANFSPSPETSRLLPERPVRRHVRIKGKIALVRSISTVNLKQFSSSASSPVTLPLAVTPKSSTTKTMGSLGSSLPWRSSATSTTASNSNEGASSEINVSRTFGIVGDDMSCTTHCFLDTKRDNTQKDPELEEEELKHLKARDGQLRGYGIGGAGNIRRPTDPYGSTTDPKKRSLREVFNLGQWNDEKLGPAVRAAAAAASGHTPQ